MSLALLLLLMAAGAPQFGPAGRFQLEYSQDGFGMRSHGIIETFAPGQTKFYPLPQSTAENYIRLRREDLEVNAFRPDQYDRQEVIGPYQVEGDKIWFGNNYYDGEGERGVGAFGYFDTATRSYTLFSPREVARYEISAILVQPEKVWIGLDRFGEDISKSPGGLVQWDRTTHAARKYALEFVAEDIRAEGGSLRLGTRSGYAIFREGTLRRFRSDGTPVARFPPPPTHN